MSHPLIFPTESYPVFLDALLGDLLAYVRLYTNDPAEDEDHVRADFVEATFPGYNRVVATRWTPAAMRHGRAFSVVDPIIFRYTSGDVGLPIRGYYVTNGEDGGLLWWRRRHGAVWSPTTEDPLLILFMRMHWPALPAV